MNNFDDLSQPEWDLIRQEAREEIVEEQINSVGPMRIQAIATADVSNVSMLNPHVTWPQALAMCQIAIQYELRDMHSPFLGFEVRYRQAQALCASHVGCAVQLRLTCSCALVMVCMCSAVCDLHSLAEKSLI